MLALCEGAEVAVGQHQAPVHMAHDSDSNCRVLHDAVRGCSSVPTQVLSPATHPPACRLTPHPPACRQANQRAACCLPISGGQLKIDSALWALLSLSVSAGFSCTACAVRQIAGSGTAPIQVPLCAAQLLS